VTVSEPFFEAEDFNPSFDGELSCVKAAQIANAKLHRILGISPTTEITECEHCEGKHPTARHNWEMAKQWIDRLQWSNRTLESTQEKLLENKRALNEEIDRLRGYAAENMKLRERLREAGEPPWMAQRYIEENRSLRTALTDLRAFLEDIRARTRESGVVGERTDSGLALIEKTLSTKPAES
jgi:hypothetical protein